MGTRGFLILGIRSYISNMGIGQANNLAGIAGISKNFLVTREAGIENNFAASPNLCSGGAALKYSSIFKRECGVWYGLLCQRILPELFQRRGGNRKTAKVVHGPIGKNCFTINVASGDGAEDARII
jgi:hypothetical protein